MTEAPRGSSALLQDEAGHTAGFEGDLLLWLISFHSWVLQSWQSHINMHTHMKQVQRGKCIYIAQEQLNIYMLVIQE